MVDRAQKLSTALRTRDMDVFLVSNTKFLLVIEIITGNFDMAIACRPNGPSGLSPARPTPNSGLRL